MPLLFTHARCKVQLLWSSAESHFFSLMPHARCSCYGPQLNTTDFHSCISAWCSCNGPQLGSTNFHSCRMQGIAVMVFSLAIFCSFVDLELCWSVLSNLVQTSCTPIIAIRDKIPRVQFYTMVSCK